MEFSGSLPNMRKAVSVAGQIAIYEWPHNWPSLIPTLHSMASSSTLMVVLAFSGLGESIGLAAALHAKAERITVSRAKQLNSAFSHEAASLYAFASDVLSSSIQDAIGQDPQAETVALVEASLELLRVLFEYYSADAMGESTPAVLNIVVGSLGTRFRRSALGALQALLLRNHFSGADNVMALFGELEGLFEALAASNAVLNEDTLSAEHEFQVQFIDVLVSLGLLALRIARRVSEHPREALPDGFGPYIQNCISLALSHPSVKVQGILMPLWVSFLRTNEVFDHETMREILTTMLELATTLLTHSNPLVLEEEPAMTIAMLDFDSEEEVKKEVRKIRRRGQALMRSITRCNGPLAVAYAAQFTSYVFDTVLPESGHDSGTHCANHTPPWIALNGSALMLSATLDALSQHHLRPLSATTGGEETEHRLLSVMSPAERQQYALDAQDEATTRDEVVSTLGGMLEAILDFKTPSPYLAGRFIALLEAFTPYLRVHAELIVPVFETVLGYLTFRMPGEEDTALEVLSGTTQNLRDISLHAVATLAIEAGEPLLDSLEDLWTFTNNVVEEGSVRRSEMVGLYRAILFILAKSSDAEVQSGVIASILEPILGEWGSDDVTSAIGSGASLAGSLGLDGSLAEVDGDSVAVFGTGSAIVTRERIFHLVSVLKVVATLSTNWAAPVLAPHFEAILGPLFALIAGMNELYTPEIAQTIRAQEPYDELYTVLEEGPDDDSLETKLGLRSIHESPEDQVGIMKWWLVHTHTEALSLLAALLRSSELFAVPDIGDALLSAVFSNLEHLPLTVIKCIITDVMAQLRRKSPDNQKAEILFPVLKPFLEFVQARLASAWDEYLERTSASSAAAAAAGSLTVKREIYMDNALRKATQAFAAFLRSLSFRLPAVSPDSGVEVPLEAQYLAENLASEFAEAALALLGWPDRQAMTIGITLCERMVPIFSQSDEFCEFIASSLLPTVLHAATLVEEESSIRKIVDTIHLMYVTLGQKMDDLSPLRNIFLQLPGVNQEGLAELEREIMGGQLTLRAQSLLWRKLLGQVLSSNVTSALYKKDSFLIDTLK